MLPDLCDLGTSLILKRFMMPLRQLVSVSVLTLLGSSVLRAQNPPRVELFAGYSYSNVRSDERHSFNGAQGNLKFNLSPVLGMVVDAGGQYRSDPDFPPAPDLFFLNFHDRYLHAYQALVGPELTRRGLNVDVFGHTLVGLFHGANRVEAHNFLALGLGGGLTVHKEEGGPRLRVQADYIPDHGGGLWFHDFRLGIGLQFTLVK